MCNFGFSLAPEGRGRATKRHKRYKTFCAFLWLFLLRGRGLFQSRIQRWSFVAIILHARQRIDRAAVHCVAERQLHIGLNFLVILIFNDLPDPLSAGRKLQGVDSPGIRWKPVFAVDLLTIGLKTREKILVVLGFEVRHSFAVSLHDLQVLIVHPDLALKVALPFFDGLWCNVENIAVDLIDHFFAEVFHVVFADIVAGEYKWLDLAEI